MNKPFQLSWGHNGPEFSNVPQLGRSKSQPNNLHAGQDSKPGPVKHLDYRG